MGKEINLLAAYPKSKRNIQERDSQKTEEDRSLARKFGKEFFDGNRKYGYGGFKYNKKYWRNVTKEMIKYYSLNNKSTILDVGCAKGFMLYDFKKHLPKAKVVGIDISRYAVNNSKKEVKKFLKVGNAKYLKFKDSLFFFKKKT